MDEDSRNVSGFVFSNSTEAQLAAKEQKNIEIIRQRTPLSDPDACYSLYCKLIERNMFKTMVGYSFLYELRHDLVDQYGYDANELPNVDISGYGKSKEDIFAEIKKEAMQEQIGNLTLAKKRMAIVIVALIAIIIGMFVVAVINPNVGYINTEHKVLNKYSAWEEDLQAREAAIKQREKELNLETSE